VAQLLEGSPKEAGDANDEGPPKEGSDANDESAHASREAAQPTGARSRFLTPPRHRQVTDSPPFLRPIALPPGAAVAADSVPDDPAQDEERDAVQTLRTRV